MPTEPLECRSVAKFLKQDAIWPHTKAGLQQFLWACLGKVLPSLRIKQTNMICLRDDEFRRVFDRDDSLIRSVNVSQVGKLFFELPDDERFPNQPHIARIFIAEFGIRSCDNDEFQRA